MFGRKPEYILLLLSPILIAGIVAFAVTGKLGGGIAVMAIGSVIYFSIWRYRRIHWTVQAGRAIIVILIVAVAIAIDYFF